MADFSLPKTARAVLLGAGLVTLGACSGDPTYYTLAPVSGVSQAGGPAVVEVRTPVIAQWLDHDDIVRQDRDYRVSLAQGDAWSGALPDQIAQTLTVELAQRLPGTTVIAQNDAASTTPAAYVELTVTNFNEDQDGQAVLRGSLSAHAAQAGAGPVITMPILLTLKPQGHSTAALVAAMSALLGQLADQAASQIRALPPIR
ncbi:PqiC family protein [Tanticharoenia sakaeratensis]|uniref:ABC-type transport auxiliary lipoprotein component domain-containing protein n=1 Tax=Tanticharoenia sakaeratensis NBRC 103193 TaxID=1231623 RepID=A0A0D6MLH1_9PROT|nr:PqiC family protein [Tanticharoenia sakaeratensis]GAN54522.1 hypothetical protein Tasa_022_021 [Tanticharoenia sakaeratensis NBRC 103193]GBQ23855.1 hypothetical protein AA103193_2554 [Tanticharoenia sakaeratensis NBRC 103193]